ISMFAAIDTDWLDGDFVPERFFILMVVNDFKSFRLVGLRAVVNLFTDQFVRFFPMQKLSVFTENIGFGIAGHVVKCLIGIKNWLVFQPGVDDHKASLE